MLSDGSVQTTRFKLNAPVRSKAPDLAASVDGAFLRADEWPNLAEGAAAVRAADLFSGCGLMTLGAWEACRAIGKQLKPLVALDYDESAAAVYGQNFPRSLLITEKIEKILNGAIAERPTPAERNFIKRVEQIELLLAGPPCQGHSNLNNHTRGDDPKNRLYDRVARFSELFSPTHVVVENVPAVLNDRGRVVDKTVAAFMRLGYSVDHAVVDLATLGVPQRRRRHVLLASLKRTPDINVTMSRYRRPVRTVRWAISDIESVTSQSVLDEPAKATAVNQKRIDYLFRHNRYDLPDHMRPDCHRLRQHKYKSVYGRLAWDSPAQTITSGFTCMGQGRYVHPRQKRTLTPHEAARLQFIPDFFAFPGDLTRTALAGMIGNAVPAKLTYVMALELLR
jgi:DNA (cytosine-5)-methyltransferase 1